MNILLTGSNGFIGSYFMQKYNKKYIINTFSFQNNEFSNLNLSRINTVIHLSALVHQMGGATKEEYFDINVNNTLELAQKAKNSGVKHFIFMSTVKVYGEESEIVYKEDTICNPQDDYGKSKLKAEIELKKLENSNFTVSIIRTPIVYGLGVKANILNLVKLVNKIPILPFGNIQNRRSMVYIGNLCGIINRIIEVKKSGIFLASDDRAISTSSLIILISKALNKKVFLFSFPLFTILLKKLKPSFYKRLYMSLTIDNSITKQKLSFSNQYTVEEGIELMIKKEKNSADK